MQIPTSALVSVTNAIDRIFDLDRTESMWQCEAAFRQALASGLPQAALNRQLNSLTTDPNFVGDWRPQHLILHRGAGYLLSIARFDTSTRFIHTAPYYGFYAPLGSTPLQCDLYDLPAHYQNAVFDPTLKLAAAGSVTTAPGELIELRTDRRVYDFRIQQPQLVLKLTTSVYDTLEWLFVRDTLTAWQANDAELRSTQLRVAAYLLGRLADASSLEPLRSLGQHPNHSVRWASIQAMGRLSRTEAMSLLERATRDPHPHNRRAAERALAASRPRTF